MAAAIETINSIGLEVDRTGVESTNTSGKDSIKSLSIGEFSGSCARKCSADNRAGNGAVDSRNRERLYAKKY